MLLSKYGVGDSKKSKFFEERKAYRLSSSLRIKTLLSKIPFVGPRLF